MGCRPRQCADEGPASASSTSVLQRIAKRAISKAISDAVSAVSRRFAEKVRHQDSQSGASRGRAPPAGAALPAPIPCLVIAVSGPRASSAPALPIAQIGTAPSAEPGASDAKRWKNRLYNRRTLPTIPYVLENRAAWLGPTKESNWVLPGRLIAGAYPLAWTAKRGRVTIHKKDLFSLLEVGVTTFVCLQDEYNCVSNEEFERQHPVILETGSKKVVAAGAVGPAGAVATEPGGHGGATGCTAKKGVIFPYIFDAARAIQAAHGSWKNRLHFMHLPIVDLNCTEDEPVLELALDLARRLAAATGPHKDAVIYLHCWGGHGRTGTLVAVILGILYALSPAEALERTQLYHDIRRCKLQVASPQTERQRAQVRRILSSAKAHAAMAEFGAKSFPAPSPSCFDRDIEFHARVAETSERQAAAPLRAAPRLEEKCADAEVVFGAVAPAPDFHVESKLEMAGDSPCSMLSHPDVECKVDDFMVESKLDCPEDVFFLECKVADQLGRADAFPESPSKTSSAYRHATKSTLLRKRNREPVPRPARPSGSRKFPSLGRSPRELLAGYRTPSRR